MKKAVFRLDPDLLRDALGLPIDCEIEYALPGTPTFYSPIALVISHPDLKEVDARLQFPLVDAVFETVYTDDCTRPEIKFVEWRYYE